MRFPLFERHPREELSSYLDNEFVFQRVEALKAHLSSCPTCRAELDALRTLKSQLATLPESPAPRSFALTPQMAQRPAPELARVRTPTRVAALSNGMRLAGAGMAAALAVVMLLNFSGSGSDHSDNARAVTAPEAFATDSTTQDSVFADSDTSTELAIPSAAATGAADNAVSTVAPPGEGVSGGTTGAVGNAPDVGNPGAIPDSDGDMFSSVATPLPEGENAFAVPTSVSGPAQRTGSSEAFSTPAPASTDVADKNVDAGSPGVDTTEGPVIKSLDTGQPAPEAAQTAATESDSGGVDILILVAIALAAGVVLTFAGSVLIPRIARDDQ